MVYHRRGGGVGQNVFSGVRAALLHRGELDEKSNGFDLEASRVRNTESLDRLDRDDGACDGAAGAAGDGGAGQGHPEEGRTAFSQGLEHPGGSVGRLGEDDVREGLGTLETLFSLLVLKELDFEVKLDKVFVSARIDRERR